MSLWYGQPLCMQKIIVKFNFFGGGCLKYWIWLARWTTVGVIGFSSLMHDQHLTSHHGSLHHLTDFELSSDSLIFKKNPLQCFFLVFGSAAMLFFFTHEKFIYKWIQTIAKKSFGASHWVPLKEGEWMSGLLYLRSQVLSSGDKLVPSLLRWTGSGPPWTDWVPLRLDQRCCLSYACC